MENKHNSVFISYRRSTSRHLARSIYQALVSKGYDVFIDVNSIDSGPFDLQIIREIADRSHFIVLLSHGSLDRCINADDWLRREIEEAIELKKNIVPIIEEDFIYDQETLSLPESWRSHFLTLNGIRLFHDFFEAAIEKLENRFLKEQPEIDVEPLISSNLFTPVHLDIKLDIEHILPSPFEWCKVTSGKVKTDYGYSTKFGYPVILDSQVEDFEIAKYPITVAQYRIFEDEVGGFKNRTWWEFSNHARDWRNKNDKPRQPLFNNDMFPRTEVSWFECIAFCKWLSNRTGDNIMLPTEQQWQRAAEGDSEFAYPWGNSWDPNLCNNSTIEIHSEKIEPVTKYQNVESPFGLIDVAGNASEWCLNNDFESDDYLNGDYLRVIRGAPYYIVDSEAFRSKMRALSRPSTYHNGLGFRIARIKG